MKKHLKISKPGIIIICLIFIIGAIFFINKAKAQTQSIYLSNGSLCSLIGKVSLNKTDFKTNEAIVTGFTGGANCSGPLSVTSWYVGATYEGITKPVSDINPIFYTHDWGGTGSIFFPYGMLLNDGTSYSGVASISFTVSPSWDSGTNAAPTVISPNTTSITHASAVLWANVTSLGIPAVLLDKGFCYFKEGVDPSLAICKSVSQLSTGVYSDAIYPLTSDTKYWFYGYAKNQTGTGTVWSSFMTLPDPSGSLTASDCLISANESSCTSNIGWETLNPIVGNISAVTTPTNITVGTGDNGNAIYSVAYGSRNFYLYHNAFLLNQATVNATCAPNTTWKVNKCVPNGIPFGVITALDCTIPIGNNTCDSNITWSTTNPVKGVISEVTTPTNIKVATGNNNSTSYAVSHGTRSFYLYHNSILLDNVTAKAECDLASALWDGNKCVINSNPPDSSLIVSFTATPESVAYNQFSVLKWESQNVASCSMFSNQDSTTNIITSLAPTTNNRIIVNPQKTTIYSLTCSGPGGTATKTKIVTVGKIKPIIIEI